MACDATGADLVLVNHQLTPVQERNLERALERRVVDRTGLILDIFAQRARAHEGKLQVELAQLKHLAHAPGARLDHLERQRGGSIGLRGPGETKSKPTAACCRNGWTCCKKRLERSKRSTPDAAARASAANCRASRWSGYTNAGKSTLFNALTGADAYAADQLFATLDPTVRRITLRSRRRRGARRYRRLRPRPAARTGRRVPFHPGRRRASRPAAARGRRGRSAARRTHRQVDEVLREIGAGDIPQLLVFNKIDRIEAPRRASTPRTTRCHGAVTDVRARRRLGSACCARRWANASACAASAARCCFPSTPAACARRLHALEWRCAEIPRRRRLALRVDLPGRMPRAWPPGLPTARRCALLPEVPEWMPPSAGVTNPRAGRE